MSDPGYQNVCVNLTKTLSAGKFCVLSSRLYILCSRSVWPRLCFLSLPEELIMRRPSGWYADNNLGTMQMELVG